MGIRIIKTAIAAVVAIGIATWLGLNFSLSAGLLAILGVDVTKKRSLVSATVRIAASVLGMLAAVLLFYIFGFYIWTLGLFILITYPVLVRLKLKDGIVTGSVVVLHVFSVGEIGYQAVWNEILLLLVGLGTATMINLLYMPDSEKELPELRRKVDGLFSDIFLHIAAHLKNPACVWDGKEWTEAVDAIDRGMEIARRTAENRLFRFDGDWPVYFHMRRQQSDSIGRMIALVAQVYENVPHGVRIADLFEQLSEDLKSEYYTGHVEKGLNELEQRFRQMPLPATREEFEVRSALLQLCLELHNYLSVAKKEKKRPPKKFQP